MKKIIFAPWSRRGSIGILTLVGMMVLGAIGAGFVMLTSTEVNTGAQYRSGVTAQYIAEAGARWAAIQLKNNVGTVVSETDSVAGHTYPTVSLGSAPTAGTYNVTIKRNPAKPTDSTQRQVVTTATVNNATRQVVYIVTLGGGGLPTKYAGFSEKNVTLAGSINLSSVSTDDIKDGYGATGAAGTVTLKWGYNDGGGKTYATAITNPDGSKKTPDGTPTGQVQVNIPAMPVSFDINDASYQQYKVGATTQATNTVIKQKGKPDIAVLNLQNYTTPSWSGNNFINGNLQLSGSTVLDMTGPTAAIYVNGDLNITSDCTIQAAGNLAIIVNGSITFGTGNIKMMTAGSTLTLYALNGVTGTSGSDITGKGNVTIISPQSVSFSGGSHVWVDNNGVINVYTQQNFTADGGMFFGLNPSTTNSASDKASITVMSSKNISITGGTPFNPGTNGTVKLYAANTFSMSGGASIAGNGLVMSGYVSDNNPNTNDYSINVTGGSSAANTVFISSGDVYSSVTTGAIYAKGNINFDYGAAVNYNENVFDSIGIATGGSFSMLPWSNKP